MITEEDIQRGLDTLTRDSCELLRTIEDYRRAIRNGDTPDDGTPILRDLYKKVSCFTEQILRTGQVYARHKGQTWHDPRNKHQR